MGVLCLFHSASYYAGAGQLIITLMDNMVLVHLFLNQTERKLSLLDSIYEKILRAFIKSKFSLLSSFPIKYAQTKNL